MMMVAKVPERDVIDIMASPVAVFVPGKR